MSRRWTREPGAPCYAHDTCETCGHPVCTDCDIPDTHQHAQEPAA